MDRAASASLRLRQVIGGLAVFAGLGGVTAYADGPAGVVTTLHGSADLTRAAAVQPLRFRDELYLQDRIDTNEESLVRVLLGGSAVVTVRELSSLTISEQPDRAVIDLRDGRVGVEVARRLMKPGQAIEIRTPNAIAAVRGSFVVVEVSGPEKNPRTEVLTRSVSLPVTVSWGGDDASLASDHAIVVAGSGATLRVTPPRILTAAERARADAVRQGPREPTHSRSLPESLEIATDEEAEKAREEVEALAREEETEVGSATSPGLNEIAAARLAALFGLGSDGPGVTPEPATARRGQPPLAGPGAPPPGVPPPGVPPPGGPPPGGPPPVGPPPVGPPVPPVVPPGAAPGFSDAARGNATHSNASPTGLMPPAVGLGGGVPPGLGKKQ